MTSYSGFDIHKMVAPEGVVVMAYDEEMVI